MGAIQWGEGEELKETAKDSGDGWSKVGVLLMVISMFVLGLILGGESECRGAVRELSIAGNQAAVATLTGGPNARCSK